MFETLKTFLRTWKPIHLCWLFKKKGWKIPKYLIGGLVLIDSNDTGGATANSADGKGQSFTNVNSIT